MGEKHAVLSGLLHRVHVTAARVVGRIGAFVRAATRPAPVVTGLLTDATRSREQLIADNALLRQQLIVAARATKRPKVAPHERALLVLLARVVPRWRDAVLLVKPETILRWHREGFRLLWRWRSKSTSQSSKLSAETIAFIRRMAEENRLWGAERIRGELLKLGLRVAKARRQNERGPAARGRLRANRRWVLEVGAVLAGAS